MTTTFAVPAMLLFVSQQPGFETADLSSFRSIVCGGAPVPESLMRLYGARGIPINQGYGLTETSPFLTLLTSEWGVEKLGSARKAPPFTEVRLVDAAGKPVTEPGERGGICARGPNVMKGYWNKPRARRSGIRLRRRSAADASYALTSPPGSFSTPSAPRRSPT